MHTMKCALFFLALRSTTQTFFGDAFVLLTPRHYRSGCIMHVADIVDAEFSYDGFEEKDEKELPKTLADISFESDPEMKNILVEFVELMPSGNRKYIECKLPFTADLDGVTYSIGMPERPTVAILTDADNGEQIMLDADDDANEEIFQIAAAELVKNMGEDFRLKRTPRVLTVEGDLDAMTRKWMPQKHNADEIGNLLDEEDEDDQFFEDFFKEQLGPNFREEVLIDKQNDNAAEDLMKLFSIPGLGTEEGDEDGVEDMLNEILSGEESATDEERIVQEQAEAINQHAKALPLFPFAGPDDRMYAFVQMSDPILIVGKEDPLIDKAQRLLLSDEEAAMILPRLKAEFRDLKEQIESA